MRMRKTILTVLMISASACLLSAAALAQTQQAPATTTQKLPAAQSQNPPIAKTAPKTSTTATKPLTLTTDRDKESYALGMNIAKGMKAQSVDIDPAIMARAMRDILSGAKPLLTDDEMTAELKQLQEQIRAKQETARKDLGDKNLKEGQAFLAANRTKEGVVALPDGLQYKVLKEGNGAVPKPSDAIVCQYRGTLIDGTEFDSSAKHGGAVTFPVDRIIKGWSEALQRMPVGSKWQLFVPPDLAYGDRGAGQIIGPNAVLVFEIELMSIQPPQSQAPAPQPSTPR